MEAIINGRLIVPDKLGRFAVVDHQALLFDRRTGRIESIVPEGRISAATRLALDDCIDAQRGYVSPGFINVHIHGAMGRDTMDDDDAALAAISRHQASTGVTAMLPTTMTGEMAGIYRALARIRQAMAAPLPGAAVLGAHLEGPFINKERCGAQNPAYAIPPDFEKIADYVDVIKLLTLAPEELNGDYSFIEKCQRNGIVVSMGHSSADYNLARRVMLQYRVSHLTHIFNGMEPFHHRTPGLVGAALDTDTDCEIICDNIHLHPVIQRLVWRMKQGQHIVLITDSMRACGLGDGESELGGRKVIVKGHSATLEDGTIAGSVLTMDRAIVNFAAGAGISIAQAVACATQTPAISLGLYNRLGSLEPGKQADITIFDNVVNIKTTIVRGQIVYQQ